MEEKKKLPQTGGSCPLNCPHLRLGGKHGYLCAQIKRSLDVRRDGFPLKRDGCEKE